MNFSKRSVSCAVTYNVYEKLIEYKNVKKKKIPFVVLTSCSYLPWLSAVLFHYFHILKDENRTWA